jgi:molybdopterin-synthase adenylyltransferase
MKTRENVFAFSMSCASMQMLQMLALALAPLNQPNPGAQLYRNITEPPKSDPCHPECQFPRLTALGDHSGIVATGIRKPLTRATPLGFACGPEEHRVRRRLPVVR